MFYLTFRRGARAFTDANAGGVACLYIHIDRGESEGEAADEGNGGVALSSSSSYQKRVKLNFKTNPINKS